MDTFSSLSSVTPIVGVCNCSMFCCTLLYVHYSIAIILMGKRELVALLYLSSWCLVMVEWLFLAVPWGCLWLVIVVFPDHTHLLFLWVVSCCNRAKRKLQYLLRGETGLAASTPWMKLGEIGVLL